MSTSSRLPRQQPETHVEQSPRAPGSKGRYRARARDVLTRRTLVVADLFSTAVVIWLVISQLGSWDPAQPYPWILVYLAIVPFVMKMLGLYDNDDTKLRHSTLDELPRIAAMAGIAVAIEWLSPPHFFRGEISHDQRLALLVGIILMVTLVRGLTRRLIVRLLPPERCIVVGSEEAAEELSLWFSRSHAFRAKVVGRVDTPDLDDAEAYGAAALINDAADENAAERIVIVPRGPGALTIAKAVNVSGTKVSIVPATDSAIASSWEVDDLIGLTMLGMRRPRLTGSSAAFKRSLDLIVGSAITLLMIPLMLLIAAAIRLDSPGRAIYRQRRVGKGGYEFTILKFRTMEVDSHVRRSRLAALNDSEGLFKIEDDPRITRVGRILRKTSLDELPQLFNVVWGEMSLVGPRPLVPEEDMLMSGMAKFRHSVLPGMTGPWQLGSAARFSLTDMATLDYVYITDWTLWGDIKILIRTVIYVIGLHGR